LVFFGIAMSHLLRPLTLDDIDFAHGLSRATGWNQTRRDWERFLSLAPGGCFLVECEGRRAGTATTTSYGGDLAWIGMVLVDPDFRRRGLGTALLEGAIRHLREERGIACVRLDATPEGRPLYEGLGFRAEWGLRRWVREPRESLGERRSEGRAGDSESPTASTSGAALDRRVFGADRGELLASLEEGSLLGERLGDGSFGMLREGERAYYLGPVTAASPGSGLLLARRLVERCPADRPIFWDLPDSNESAIDLAGSLGFAPVRILTRMWLGEAALPSHPSSMFGIAEPGLG
jgi:GNAT superfamily N-acetyltransferase